MLHRIAFWVAMSAIFGTQSFTEGAQSITEEDRAQSFTEGGTEYHGGRQSTEYHGGNE